MDLGLNGKNAIITGGSDGIGLAAAISLSKEGANVAILARTQEKLDKLIKDLDINVTKLRIDMGKDETKNIVKLSSFIAMGSGSRGTPALFFNEEFLGGYVPVNQLERFLK